MPQPQPLQHAGASPRATSAASPAPDGYPAPFVGPADGSSPSALLDSDDLAELALAHGIDPGPLLAPDERPRVRARLRALLGLNPAPDHPAVEPAPRRPAAPAAMADGERTAAAETVAGALLSLFEPEGLSDVAEAFTAAVDACRAALEAASLWSARVATAADAVRPLRDVDSDQVDQAMALVLSRTGRNASAESLLCALGVAVQAKPSARIPASGLWSRFYEPPSQPPRPARPRLTTRPSDIPARLIPDDLERCCHGQPLCFMCHGRGVVEDLVHRYENGELRPSPDRAKTIRAIKIGRTTKP